ncbi:hypothetical protein HK100_007683 [Physocladia obscura]|uniref:t-SNARE coiled-coil homology domain-containing protein n=1 Tax=Physocladia obscura TaxID=109957 RepID=A0AAD5T557_9FUNG|nr:hypothetical protein HK100_007683 [Physocladia obscura]
MIGIPRWFPCIKIKFPKWKKENARFSNNDSKCTAQFSEEILPISDRQEELEKMAFDIQDGCFLPPPPSPSQPLPTVACQKSQNKPPPQSGIRDLINQEIDGNLDALSASLVMLKMASFAMGQEIETQNQKLGNLANSVEHVSGLVSNVDTRLKKLSNKFV